LSVGGGLGIQYKNEKVVPLNRYAQAILSTVKKKKLEILCEPGRIIVGDAGALVCEVQYIKKARSKLFAIVNTGMHHLMRPALYGAYHSIVSLKKNNSKPNTYEVVGPICESTDVL